MPAFPGRHVTNAESQQALVQRSAQRSAIFVELMQRAVFENPSSADFQLFRHGNAR
jgi:hypothetical protein